MTDTRLLTLDIARSVALLGMVAFHFTFDLQVFGLVAYGTTAAPFFYWHARLVAGAFLFLAGVSLWLAHGDRIRWPAFWRRWLKIAFAAALVSIATFVAMPDYYVYFGILHSIALCSLLALPFLRLPAIATAAAGIAVMATSYVAPSPVFNAPLLRFLGLATEPSLTVDFEPLIPWLGPLMIGLAAARFLGHSGLARLAIPSTPLTKTLAWPGQHSLRIYLVHQPLLMGLIWTYIQII